MTVPTPVDTASAYFAALAEGDVAAAMARLSPAVVWSQPGANRFSGEHHGTDGVGAHIGAMMEATAGSFRLDVDGPLMSNGDLVAVPVRFSGQCGDAVLDMAGVDLLTVRDGAITAVQLFSADGATEDAFWGPA